MSGSTARTVTIRVAVEDADARRRLEQLGEKGTVSLQQIESASRSASAPMQGLAGVSDGLALSFQRLVPAANIGLGGVAALTAGAVAAAAAIAKAGDEYTQTMARLSSATGSTGAAAQVFTELQRLAAQTGVSVAESANAFSRFSIAAREVGATNAEVLALTRTIQQAGILAGSSTQETASAILQLGQALASGRLQGDELRSILESMPTLAEALARELGVSVGQLRQMGSEGQLTADRVMPALLRAGERINKEFADLPVGIGHAFGILSSATQGFLGQLDQALGVSQAVSAALQFAAAELRGAQAAITPLTDAQRAQRTQEGAQARITNLRGEIERVESEQPPPARRGSLRPGLADAASGSREERLASLRAELADQQRIESDAATRRAQRAREAQEKADAEEATAAARRAEAQRRRATEDFNKVRDDLDRERKLREDHRTRIASIDAGEVAGATDAATAARLRTRANEELAEGLRKLDPPTRAAAASRREGNEAEREAQRLAREGEQVTASVRTEQEKFAVEQERLNRLLEQGVITRETYNRALAAADPAVRQATEQARQQQQQAEREAQRQQQAADQFVARYSADLAKGTTDALFDGFEKGKSFGQSMADGFRRSLRTAATSALDALVFRPVMQMGANALGFGTPVASLSSGIGSFFGGASGTGGAAQAAALAQQGSGGGLMQTAGMAGSASSLYRSISSFNPGAIMAPGYTFNTGFGMVDGVLNMPLTGAATYGASSIAPGSLALGSEPAAYVGNSLNSMGGGLSLGSAAAGSIGAAAGAYGVYSGLERGGIGGYTQAAGSALTTALSVASMAGMSMGPPGWIAAAILQIVGALLPGEKPSSKGQTAYQSFDTGATGNVGLTGDRFSQANLDEAGRFAANIGALEAQLQSRLGFGASGEVAVGVTSGRGGNDPGKLYLGVNSAPSIQFDRTEEGAKLLAERAAALLLDNFKDLAGRGMGSADIQAILRASGDVTALGANLDWYEQTYKPMVDAANGAAASTNAFAVALAQLTKPFDDAIAKAGELGLATDALSRKRDEEAARATRARDLTVQGIDYTLAARLGGGDPVLLGTIRQAQASIAAEQEVDALRQQLLALGETAAATETRLDKLRQVQALYGDVTEAQFQAAAQSAGGAIGSLASYAAGLSTGDANPGTVLDRLAAAQAQFDRTSAGALAGDASALGGLQGAAETYRTLLRATYGGGAGYADGFARIADVIGQVADRGADRWTQDFARAETDRLVDPLMAIRDGIAALRRDLALAAARPA